ncbi:putative protein LAX PANICLE 2 [Dioscorea sansibarensis]
MVPARNLLRRHYDSYGSCFSELHHHQPRQTMKAPLMAEEETKIRINEEDEDEEEEEETGTSSKGGEEEEEEEDEGEDDDDDDWLQLGVGNRNVKTPKMPGGDESRRLMELPLFSDKPTGGGGGSRSVANTSSVMPLFPAMGQQVRRPWGLWTTTVPNPMFASSSNRYDYHRHQYMYPRSQVGLNEVISSPAATGLRIVNPPRRPQAGVWFILQTKQNQGREPFLPQIPKSYLRIKDGRMTVRLLKKYLVNKLGLEDESQVEITCKGQELLPSWTLQYVRDNVWFSGETMMVLLPESPAADQVMTLQYGRPARSI